MAFPPATHSRSENEPSRADAHARLAAMAPVYVVDALGSDDLSEFEGHLTQCAVCTAEVTRVREIAVVLAQAVSIAGKSPINEIVAHAATSSVEAVSENLAQLEPSRLDALELENAQLRTALSSRIVLEQATGVLVERLNLAPQEAFELLRSAARRSRMKIHALAEEVVTSRTTPAQLVHQLQSRAG